MTAALRIVALLAPLTACATDRYAAFERLPEEGRAQYARYEQFMTERQRDTYLELTTQEARDTMIAGLNVEARLSMYPQAIQDAIWSRDVVIGMDKKAVILAVGAPERVERDIDSLDEGLDRQVWVYRGGALLVRFLGEVVTEVDR